MRRHRDLGAAPMIARQRHGRLEVPYNAPMRCPWSASILLIASLGCPALAGPKLTLDDVMAKAMAGPRAQIAKSDVDSATARSDEADAARYPHILLTAFGTISPKITCEPSVADCVQTDPQTFAFDYQGVYGDAELKITQPLYTFGKITHARNAARAGVLAEGALADEAAGDIAVDAARAYWGVKVARELTAMLDDGVEQIEGAVKDFQNNPSATTIDRQRVKVLLAEAKAQRADAAQQERAALAGLRAVTNLPDADVDDELAEPVAYDLPGDDAVAAAADHRPQAIAAHDGAIAADELADFEHAQLFPDFAVIAGADASDAQGVADPSGAFWNNPFNRFGAGAVLGLQWTIEPWNAIARTDRARADARKAHATAELARIGARYDLEGALAEATGARDKLAARDDGQKQAKTWLASVLQAESIGTASPRDLADSYINWFSNRAAWGAAVFEWNVAIIRLRRAMGEFHAGAPLAR
jgi:outer membrane protein TolC